MFGVDLYLEYKRARENAPHEGEGHSSNNHHPSQVSIVYVIEKLMKGKMRTKNSYRRDIHQHYEPRAITYQNTFFPLFSCFCPPPCFFLEAQKNKRQGSSSSGLPAVRKSVRKRRTKCRGKACRMPPAVRDFGRNRRKSLEKMWKE